MNQSRWLGADKADAFLASDHSHYGAAKIRKLFPRAVDLVA
jgi:hypothetical protein